MVVHIGNFFFFFLFSLQDQIIPTKPFEEKD
jgi:hypothetical protein